MRRFGPKLGILVVSLVLSLGVTEVVLRAVGFRYQIKPERVEFGWPPPVTMENMYRTDPTLFWVTRDYPEKLRQLERGGLDIAFLGDSCTEFGTYPGRLLAALRERHPDTTIEAENFGVGGWSSYQGLQQFRRDILPLQPRVVTFYFGWNDHWIGFGIEDKDLAPPDEAEFGWGRLRLSQLVLKAQLGYRTRRQGYRPERVAPRDFRRNLQAVVRLARDNGIVPVLLTAPTSHAEGREPAYLTDRWLRRLEDLVPLHQRYVSIVREVAEAEGAVLCDLARDFESFPREQLAGELFLADGIHPTPAGDDEFSKFLLRCFEESAELSDAWDRPH